MTPRWKIAAPLMLVTAGAVAATTYNFNSVYVPAPSATGVAPAEASRAVAPPDESTVTSAPDANAPAAPPAAGDVALPEPSEAAPSARPHRPVVEHLALPRSIVTAPRPSNDELLRTAVMDRLLAARLSGRIGVEAYQHTVSLTGRVMSTQQIERAEQVTRGVDGVWEVNNDLRARVGES